jgi:hypothetical protein
MKTTIYRQNDPRWAKLPYPGGGCTIGGSGCGCCSIANIIIEIPKHAKETPATIQPYMKQWARCGDGTKRVGIEAAMKHYGFVNVMEHPNMASLWKALAKGGRVGVIEMGSKKVNGHQWTTSAHYLAFTDYKVENGKHYLYMKDSGWRHHDEWYAYETTFYDNGEAVWSGEIPKRKKLTPNGKARRDIVKWGKKIAADNSYRYVTWNNHDKRTQLCPVCHPSLKGKYKGWNCIMFAIACWHHGGQIPIRCACLFDNGMATRWKNLTVAKATAEIRKAFGIKQLKAVKNRGKGIPESMLVRGDMVLFYKANGQYRHTAVYAGKGKIVDATPQAGEAVRPYNPKHCLLAIHYTGRGKY